MDTLHNSLKIEMEGFLRVSLKVALLVIDDCSCWKLDNDKLPSNFATQLMQVSCLKENPRITIKVLLNGYIKSLYLILLIGYASDQMNKRYMALNFYIQQSNQLGEYLMQTAPEIPYFVRLAKAYKITNDYWKSKFRDTPTGYSWMLEFLEGLVKGT